MTSMQNQKKMISDLYKLDKHWVKKNFERSAVSYDKVAVLQREVADRLLERLEVVNMLPNTLLDVGTGTGRCSQLLAKKYKKAQIYALDISLPMLQQARGRLSLLDKWRAKQHFMAGDAEHLPIKSQSIDFLISNMALQWCEDLPKTLSDFRRVIRPGGLVLFSTFGPDTLKELRACWAKADQYTHVNGFLDMHDIGDMMLHSGFADPVLDVETFTLTYTTVHHLMKDLKQLGSKNVTHGRSRGLTGKGRLQQVIDEYEQFRDKQRLPVTYEVVYGHAWVTEAKRSKIGQQAEVVAVPVHNISFANRKK